MKEKGKFHRAIAWLEEWLAKPYKWLLPFGQSWIGHWLNAVLIVAVGGIGSLYAEDIRAGSPINISWPEADFFTAAYWNEIDFELAGWPLLFWVALVGFFFNMGLHQYARYRQDQMREDQIQRLGETLATLPPEDFLLAYQQTLSSVEKDVEQCLAMGQAAESEGEREAYRRETVPEVIRYVLHRMTRLAELWDHAAHDNSIVYRANIMLYYPATELSRDEKAAVFEHTRFVPEPNPDALFSSIDGVLVVCRKYTVKFNNRDETADPDPDIEPFALGVTYPNSKAKRDKNIPGAPDALLLGKPRAILDCRQTIPELCAETGAFSVDELEDIRAYYRDDAKGRSLLCIPLEGASAVVNLYRNEPAILKDERRARQFSQILAAFGAHFRTLLQEAGDLAATECLADNSLSNDSGERADEQRR